MDLRLWIEQEFQLYELPLVVNYSSIAHLQLTQHSQPSTCPGPLTWFQISVNDLSRVHALQGQQDLVKICFDSSHIHCSMMPQHLRNVRYANRSAQNA